MIYIYKPDIKYFVVSSLLLLAALFTFAYYPSDKINSAIATAMGGVFLIKFRKSIPLLILFLFIFTYAYESTKYFYGGIPIAIFKDFNKNPIINKVLLVNSIFIFTLGNVISSKVVKIKMDLSRYSFKSVYVFWILVVIGLFMIQFGIRGQSLLSGGGYGAAEKSTLHEYFILLFFLLLLTRPDHNRAARITIFLMYFVYCFKTAIYGGRIEILQVTLLLFFFYWVLPQKVWKSVVFALILVGLYMSSVVSNVRERPMDLIKGNYAALFNPFRESPPRSYLGTNQGDVLYSSARLTGFVDQGIMDSKLRVKSFFYFMTSIVVTTSALPEYANLAAYKKIEYGAGGGGLIGTFFYVWFGYLGPVLIGLYLGFFINKGFRSQHVAFKIYAVIILVMFPRWYSYGPILLFKLCGYTVLMYLVFALVFKVFFKKSNFANPTLLTESGN